MKKGLSALGVTALLTLPSGVLAADCTYFEFGTEIVDGVSYCASSFLPKSNVATYGPGNLNHFDRGPERAWCEGVSGSGQGEWIEIQVSPWQTVRTVFITNGYQKTKATFKKNARAKIVSISTDSGYSTVVRLADTWGEQAIRLDGWVEFSRLRLSVRSVYPGSRYDDLCISGFGVDFEERREFEWEQSQ